MYPHETHILDKFKDEYLSAKLICEEKVFTFYHPIACRIYSALPTYCVLNYLRKSCELKIGTKFIALTKT